MSLWYFFDTCLFDTCLLDTCLILETPMELLLELVVLLLSSYNFARSARQSVKNWLWRLYFKNVSEHWNLKDMPTVGHFNGKSDCELLTLLELYKLLGTFLVHVLVQSGLSGAKSSRLKFFTTKTKFRGVFLALKNLFKFSRCSSRILKKK